VSVVKLIEAQKKLELITDVRIFTNFRSRSL